MQITVGLLVGVKCSFCFEDKLIFWRERNRGMDVRSYLTANVIIDFIFAVIPMTNVFVTVYYFIYWFWAHPDPLVKYRDYWVSSGLLICAASGWGYLFSALLPSRLASAGAVIIIFLVMAFGSPPVLSNFVGTDNPYDELVVFGTVARWSTQWLAAAIYSTESDQRCIAPWNRKPLHKLGMMNLGGYASERCDDGNLNPFDTSDYVMGYLKRRELRDTKQWLMKSVSSILSADVRDVYTTEGLLNVVLGPYVASCFMLLCQDCPSSPNATS